MTSTNDHNVMNDQRDMNPAKIAGVTTAEALEGLDHAAAVIREAAGNATHSPTGGSMGGDTDPTKGQGSPTSQGGSQAVKVRSVEHWTQPCWVLRNPDGSDCDDGAEGITHYDSAAEAAEAIQPEWDPQPAPVQLTQGCWVVACAGCLEDLDCDSFSKVHFSSESDARWQAGEYDWVTGPDGELYCGTDCLPESDEAAS